MDLMTRRRIMLAQSAQELGVLATATGNPMTFTTDLVRRLHSLVIPFTPIQAAGTPTPDNPLPISGWTGANVEQRGKNLLPNKTYDGRTGYLYLGQETDYREYPFYLKAGEYTFKADNSVNANFYFRVFGGASTKVTPSGSQNINVTFTIPSDGWYQFYLYASEITASDVTRFQLEFGSTASTYEPYRGETIPINWQTEAGTIYDGSFTLNEDGSADVVATWVGDTITINNLYSPANDNVKFAYFTLSNSWRNMAYTMASAMTRSSKTFTTEDNIGKYISYSAANKQVAVSIAKDATKSDAESLYNGTQFVYELYTPVTYHFDNIGQLYTYLGTNTIWTDTNGTNTAEYWIKNT